MTIPALVSNEMLVRLKYVGPEPDRGRMDSSDLGPAIFGFGNAVAEAARLLYGDEMQLRVEVAADFQHASFGINLLTVSDSVGLIGPLTFTQIATIASFLGLNVLEVGKGVIGLIRKQAGRTINNVTYNGPVVNFHFGDGPLESLGLQEFRGLTDNAIREGLRQVLAPVARPGVDGLVISTEEQAPVVLAKEDVPLFAAPHEPNVADEDLGTNTARTLLEIVSPDFRLDYVWKFAEGGDPFSAKVDDEDFLAKVARHLIMFGAGDVLEVELETTTTRVNGRPRFRKRITHVHRVIVAQAPSDDQLDMIDG
jgi:hypothetical protein